MSSRDLLTEVSPNRGTLTYTYDAAGNRKTMLDDRNITVSYSYDLLNRLTAIDYPGSDEDVSYQYDGSNYSGTVPNGIGRLTGITDAAGSTELRYDNRGNLIQRAQAILGQSYVTEYRYNSADRMTGITYPSGMVVSYTLNNLGQISRISVTIDGQSHTLASTIGYLPFGPMNALTYGNGNTWSASHDASYRITQSQISGAYDKTYGYSTRDLITGISDAIDPNQSETFGYDPLARLTDADTSSRALDFGYDGVGNRTQKSAGANTETYAYTLATQQLASISGSRTTSFTYDAIGNITSYDGKTLAYNTAGRLSSISENATTLYSNTYSEDGHRVIKATDGATTVFIYGPDGQLIAEHHADGTPIREYIYLNGAMIGLATKRHVDAPTGDLNEGPLGGLLGGITEDELPESPVTPTWELFYVTTDHLGTPRLITDTEQEAVWQASYSPFGEIDIQTELVTMPVRFPGQYHDAESGIHQNWYRDYEPTLGRYLQSDPIGLAGGLNTYGYVGQNPLSWIDPLGLYQMCHRDLLTPIPYARHCYVRFEDGSTSSFDPNGVGPDPDPGQEGTMCSEPQEPEKDSCIRKAMSQCEASSYDFTGFNCCHCVEEAMKQCGTSIPTNQWPNWPFNPGPQPGEPGYSPAPRYGSGGR